MKCRTSWWPLALISVACLMEFVTSRDCSCSYHKGGCIISEASPSGFKCRCSLGLLVWLFGIPGSITFLHQDFLENVCGESAFPCVGEEKCPGNLADYCACKLGGGDCNGYANPVTECKDSGRPRIGVAGSGACDCKFHNGGCTIYEPAPFGWKCFCKYAEFTCIGMAQQCAAKEVCLGDDYSYCGCQQGGGDCYGYPDKPHCNSPYVSTTCDCDNAYQWNQEQHTIHEVDYDVNNRTFDESKITVLVEKDILNDSGGIQSITFSVRETMTQTYQFERTEGIVIETGMTFTAGIPEITAISGSLNITNSSSHTYGKYESFETFFQTDFTCSGVPHKHTKCSVIMEKRNVSVPYTMTLKHKIIPNCECKSFGIWTGTKDFSARLSAKEMEDLS